MMLKQIVFRGTCCMAIAASLLLAGCGGGTGASAQKPQPSPNAAAAEPEAAASESPFKLAAAVQADEEAPTGNWGTLRGRFLYEGTPPKPEPIVPTKDSEVCGQHNLVDETLVVSEGGEIANIFVYIYVPFGQKLNVHESYSETADDKVVLDNAACRFDPHCLTLRLSQTLLIKSSDTAEYSIGHNTNFASREEAFNEMVPAGGMEKNFKIPQNLPLAVKCNIHTWMSGQLLIRDDPYMALSAADGSFEIKNIPAGSHEFVFWHERPGNLGNLNAGKLKTDRRGRMKIEIPAGKVVELGEIKIPADSLKSRY